jgi:AhpD family alkylhydroperoxidase
MTDTVQHPATPDVGAHEANSARQTRRAFEELTRAIFSEGALDSKTKQLIAVAVAQITHCPYCIDGHIGLARRAGATPEEITEAIWVATEIHPGGTFVHPTRAWHVPPNSAPTCCPAHNRSH